MATDPGSATVGTDSASSASPVEASFDVALLKRGIPQPRVQRKGAPHNKAPVRYGPAYLKWVVQRYILGHAPNQFNYSKLKPDEIRLLQLQPATNKADPIHCTMFKAKLKDVANHYEALSYTWGEIPEVHHSIYINDLNPPPKEPRKDLWQALVNAARWEKKLKDKGMVPSPVLQERLKEKREELYIKPKALEVTGQTRAAQPTIVQFHVRPNLYLALVNLRKVDRPLNIWIDAICINQQRDGQKEKEEQLAHMAEIYGNATHVSVWLGQSDTRSEAALELVERMMDFQQLDGILGSLTSRTLAGAVAIPPSVSGRERLTSNGVYSNTTSTALDTRSQWYDLLYLLRSAWFSRRWIIQEICMAKQAFVHVGEAVIHWDDVCDAINLLNEKADDLRNMTGDYDALGDIEGLSASILVKVIGNACRKADDGTVSVKLMTLETLVCSLLSFDSFHSHDAIYSLIAIAGDFPHDCDSDKDFTIRPNFKRSTRDLFISFVRRSIITSGSLDIICRHWAPSVTNEINEEMVLPSWVSSASKSSYGRSWKDHGLQHGENFVAFHHSDTRRRYNASAGTNIRFEIAKLQDPTTPQKASRLVIGESRPEPHHNRDSSTRSISAFQMPTASPASITNTPIVNSPTVKSPTVKLPTTSGANDPVEPLELSSFPLTDKSKTSHSHNPSIETNGGGRSSTEGERDIALKKAPSTLPSSVSIVKAEKSGKSPKQTPPKLENGKRSKTNGESSFRKPTGSSTPSGPTSNKKKVDKSSSPTQIPGPKGKSAAMERLRKGMPEAPSTTHRGTTVDDKKDRLSGILSADGFCIGTVSEISGPMLGTVDGEWVKKLGWQSAEINENAVPDALWRTLVADRGPDGGTAPYWYRRACLHALADVKITDEDCHVKVSKYATRFLGEMTHRYLKRIETVLLKRRIFSAKPQHATPESFFGLAPEHAKVDDLVCILFGCSVPVVLRMIADGGKPDDREYELIGEAYVHGMMQGEAVKEWKKRGAKGDTFRIS